MVDPTITRKDGTFTINIEGKAYEGYTLKSCGHPIGRRTVVFKPVIKEQYLCCPTTATNTEIQENAILERIYKPEMPGVVRVFWGGWVKRADESTVECGMGDRKRQKARLVLRDEGTLFMGILTPYDALVTAWDVLEGT